MTLVAEHVSLVAVAKHAAGNVIAKPALVWSSDSPAVATVDSTGRVTSIDNGHATISATGDGAVGRTTLEIVPFELRSINAGGGSNCGLSPAGLLYCWGRFGENPDGVSGSDRPVAMDDSRSYLSVSGAYTNSCALTTANDPYCWGSNAAGQFGIGTDRLQRPGAVRAAGAYKFSTVALGPYATCGITLTGSAFCWGESRDGMLGDGTDSTRLTPVPVSGGLTFQGLSLTINTTCGVTTAHGTYCWGAGSSPVPVALPGAVPFDSIAQGASGTCALTPDGTAYCWGAWSVLGDGSIVKRQTPQPVTGGLKFTSISVGRAYVCGITTNADAYCWGENESGQLGRGTTLVLPRQARPSDPPTIPPGDVPTLVLGGLKFKSISASHSTTCAVTTTNVGYCWGANTYSQVGDDTQVQRLVPTRVHRP